ncbi:MAG: hypothetical protein HZC48_07280 [Nitrospirae bacterium]|nr:hypothetical protein [Nitrospirota bacterium]
MTDLMPVIFFGHGNPMNALSKNAYTDAWVSIGRSIPRPKAVLAVSALNTPVRSHCSTAALFFLCFNIANTL